MSNNENKFGFSLIIGNPPYIGIHRLKETQYLLEKQRYKTFIKSTDIYVLFYEKSLNLLAESGISSLITSNKWLQNSYGHFLRDFLSKNSNPLVLIDFNYFKFFEKVSVDSNILIYQKHKNNNKTKAVFFDNSKSILYNNYSDYFNNEYNLVNTKKSWLITSKIKQGIIDKVNNLGKPFKELGFNIYSGTDCGYLDCFFISKETKENLIKESPKCKEFIYPILRGRNIKKYEYYEKEDYIIYFESGFTNTNKKEQDAEIYFKENYISVYNHILSIAKKQNKLENLFDRESIGDYFWESRKCSYFQKTQNTKIVWSDLSKDNNFCLDTKNYLVLKGCFFSDNIPKYAYAILNSKLILSYFKSICVHIGRNTLRWLKVSVEKIPIISVSEKDKLVLENYIDLIHENKLLNMNTKEIEDKIDMFIFELYQLNTEEISDILND